VHQNHSFSLPKFEAGAKIGIIF